MRELVNIYRLLITESYFTTMHLFAISVCISKIKALFVNLELAYGSLIQVLNLVHCFVVTKLVC